MSMESAMAEVEIRQFALAPRREIRALTVTRPTWPIVQIVLGGLFCTYFLGWVQDFQRIRDLRAEPVVPLTKVVITKQEAWERIHTPRGARRASPQARLTIPRQTVRLATTGPATSMNLALNTRQD